MNEPTFSHLDETGAARMVDIGDKPIQKRAATAKAEIICKPETIAALQNHSLPKGDVFSVARIAAIQAAKKTSDLIPLCHAIPLTSVEVLFQVEPDRVVISAEAKTADRTGVEMEALTAVSVAALTIYDMCKAVDKTMHIEGIILLQKTKQ